MNLSVLISFLLSLKHLYKWRLCPLSWTFSLELAKVSVVLLLRRRGTRRMRMRYKNESLLRVEESAVGDQNELQMGLPKPGYLIPANVFS